jgi:hypothetical protein
LTEPSKDLKIEEVVAAEEERVEEVAVEDQEVHQQYRCFNQMP